MRKRSPENDLQTFEKRLDEQEDYYAASWDALDEKSAQTIATENFCLAIGVLFEGYVNDLIVTYANRDCSALMGHLERGVEDALKGRRASTAYTMFGDFRPRKHLSIIELKNVLDPEGRNTSFPSYAAVLDRTKTWLTAAHHAKFDSLTATDRAIVDAVIATRNNLAHRSASSLKRLNDAFGAGALHETGLKQNVYRIQRAGYYLKTMKEGSTRADIMADRLRHAVRKLV